MFKPTSYPQVVEEDDIPLCQYLPAPQQKPVRRQPYHRFVAHQQGYFQPIITTPAPVQKRPSYPTTPSLLDTYSDDEDDQDLVPIAVLQSPVRNQQFQSVAEKYKEKVKAQLQQI